MSDKGKRDAELYNIKLIPALAIDNKILVNPNERQLREVLEGVFDPRIISVKPKITVEDKTQKIIHSLAMTVPKA